MSRRKPKSPLAPNEILDLYFLDARHKLIEIAAFLDRFERTRRADPRSAGATNGNDYRFVTLKKAIKAVAKGGPNQAIKVQMIFSDPTTTPLKSAAGMKGATGAWKGEECRSRSRSKSKSKSRSGRRR